MPRIRTIKPELAEDETLGQMSRDARLLFILIWTRADDHGRFRASPAYLRGQLYPFDDDVSLQMVGSWLAELEDAGRVRCYSVRGERYAVVSNWHRHQRIDNAGRPFFPEPPDCAGFDSADDSRKTDAGNGTRTFAANRGELAANRGGSPLDLDLDLDLDQEGTTTSFSPSSAASLGEPRRKRGGERETRPEFEDFWNTWPDGRQVSRPAAERAWAKATRTTDPAEVVAGARRWSAWWAAVDKDPQFIPYPANWLRDRHWQSEPPPVEATGSKHSAALGSAIDAFLAKGEDQ